MTIDKRMKYEMQGDEKPARNYLGTQKTVSGIPVKWKSGPDAPSTELAYITKAEKDLLLKKNLHGSLKNGPNTGPDGIMSLDSQGDYTRDRSPQGRSRQGQAQHDAQMKSILTGQQNIGQTTKTGPKTRKYAVPEYVKVKQPGGGYKDKYIGSGYKSYGTPSFFGNLFSRGAPGYRGIKGMPAFFGKPKFDFKQGPDGMGYYSDYEKFGDTRDPVPLGIMGLIANAINKFKKPKDMTEFNKLTLGGTHPAALDFDPNAKIQDTAFSKTVTPNTRSYGPWTQGEIMETGLAPQDVLDELAAEESSQAWDNFVPPTGTNYPGNVGLARPGENTRYGERGDWGEWFDTHPATGESVLSGAAQNMIKSGTALPAGLGQFLGDTVEWGEKTFDPFNQKEINIGPSSYDARRDNVPSDMDIFNERFAEVTRPQYNTLKALGQVGNTGGNVGEIKGMVPAGTFDSIQPSEWEQIFQGDKFKDIRQITARGGRVGYANGGLATLFTRRG